jgi:hypothetical protein
MVHSSRQSSRSPGSGTPSPAPCSTAGTIWSAGWAKPSSLPSPARTRIFGELAAVGGRLYLAGGFSPVPGEAEQREPNRSIEVYDPATNRWSTLCEELPVALNQLRLLALSHRLLVVGMPANQENAVTLMFIDPTPALVSVSTSRRDR